LPTSDNIRLAAPPFAVSTSIRRKLTAIIMSVSAAALVLSGVLVVFSQMAVFRKSMALDHEQQAQMIANNCLAAVSFNDPEDATLILRTLASRASLAYASVSKADGEILATYRREGFNDEPLRFTDAGKHMFTSFWLLARAPIMIDGESIGTAFLQSDLRDLAVFWRQVTTIVAVSLLTAFLMAWVASFSLQRMISAPIERLIAIVRDVSRHRDYAVRAENIGRDEIGVLANAFNEMLSEVQLRDEQIREREQRTQAYLDVADVMIVAFDLDGRVTLINPRGCEILGLEEHDIVGKDWLAHFVPMRFRDSTRKVFAALMRGESRAMTRHENAILTGDGEERLIAWNNSVIRDNAGQVIFILSSGEDITDHRQAQEREVALRRQLARAERMETIGVLAGGVAHDLNNILGPIVALPEMIEADVIAATPDNTAARADILRALGMMSTSANRAASVVRDLLALSKKGHYERVPTDINKMPSLSPESACIRDLRECCPNVKVKLHKTTEALMVPASADHLCRVVDNLVRNAAEAITVKGTVTVTTSKRHLREDHDGYTILPAGDYAVIAVTDTGCGIEPDDMNRMFEPFYTRKSKTGRSGSGLGLSIVHGIVEDHDGHIDVESQIGRGTTFTLYLPLTRSPEIPAMPDESPLISGTGRILVVDDEPGQRFLASSSLKRLGYTVGVAEDGHSAVRLFTKAMERGETTPYDLVVLDMRMEPGFDGLDALRAIRTLYPEQSVLIASGHAEDDRSTAALAMGAKWLAKPYRIQGLARAVAEMLIPDCNAA